MSWDVCFVFSKQYDSLTVSEPVLLLGIVFLKEEALFKIIRPPKVVLPKIPSHVCLSGEVFWCKNLRDGNTCTCVNTWTNGITCVRANVFGRIHLVFLFLCSKLLLRLMYVVFVWIVSWFYCWLAIESFVKVETIIVMAHRARDTAQMTETSHYSSSQLW